MRLATAICTSLIIASSLGPVSAEPEVLLPTDNDLMAGYCMGAALDQMDQLEKHPPDEVVLTPKRKAEAHAEAKRSGQRLLMYLYARGYIYGPQDVEPIVLAVANGKADNQGCMARMTSSEATEECSKSKTPERLAACLIDTPACVRVHRCAEFKKKLPM